MTMDSRPAKHRPCRSRISLRWLYVLIASALLHLLVINWSSGYLGLPAMHVPENPTVNVAILEAPPLPKPVIKAAVQPPKRKVRPAPPRMAAPSAPSSTVASIEAVTTDTQTGDVAGSDLAADAGPATPDAVALADDQAAVRYNIDLPPSADLKYNVQKISRDGAPMYGSGTIRWHTDGSRYTVDGDFGVLFITALRFQSKGAIEGTGIVPELYSEKRFRKAETNTHFHRERNTISFSSSELTYPRTGGEQDRASIIWQLAGIGRGDSEKFVPGTSIKLFVAGTRNAETWQIMIIGQEEITIDGNTMHAWHVARAPRSGSYDQKLDIWLAPEQSWYPVRLRYTEPNGDYLDMSLTSLNVSPTP